MHFFTVLVSHLLFLHFVAAQTPVVRLEDAKFWRSLGESQLRHSLERKVNVKNARNVIIFVGDGMGITTITASRIYKEQRMGHTGEEGYLNFEKFPHVGLLKTYNVDKQVPDSAGTATAMFTGVKNKYSMLGLDAQALYNVCDSTLNEQSKLSSIMDWAQLAGKDTGLVTTTRVTHATPGALYCHSNNRDWECDGKIPEQYRTKCKDIARQLVEDEPGKRFKVILGGGQQQFGAPSSSKDSSCVRSDGRNLVDIWMKDKVNRLSTYKYVNSTVELMSVDTKKVEYLLGLFSPGHMPYNSQRNRSAMGQPSLVNMTTQAIRMLQKNKKGFVLMVEGGRIDHAHHENLAELALQEAVEFDSAVGAAAEMTNPQDTLIIVTADHSHTLTVNGYPSRGNDILGFGGMSDQNMPYETLTYANGPSYYQHRVLDNESPNVTWKNLSEVTKTINYRHFSPIPLSYETHGGEDVAVYAQGPYSHLFSGVYEQNHIAYVVAYASCIGSSINMCQDTSTGSSAGTITEFSPVLLLLLWLGHYYIRHE